MRNRTFTYHTLTHSQLFSLYLHTHTIHQHTHTGFVANVRRMNVALTRAKHALWVVGDAQVLADNRCVCVCVCISICDGVRV
jgi:hypothetical protein